MVTLKKSAAEIAAMREGGRMLATILAKLERHVLPGVSTKELADIAARELKILGGKASFLGYEGFPDVICVSLNDEVVHGIPSRSRVIKPGDIVSLDFGVTYRGMIVDGAISVTAGSPKAAEHQRLLSETRHALDAGIAVIHDRVRTGDIGAAIEAVLNAAKLGVVRDLVGHGVGHQLHEDPNIPNYGHKDTGPWLSAGMTIAVEPMATLGGERIQTADNNWTVTTTDGSMAAHFEHTVLITEDDAEILTKL